MTLPYETCLALKEAGFSQDTQHWLWFSGTSPETLWCVNVAEHHLRRSDGDFVAAPQLHELIAACGDDFSMLWRTGNGKWAASNPIWDGDWAGTDDEPENALAMTGDTPEEAVAALYLALRKG